MVLPIKIWADLWLIVLCLVLKPLASAFWEDQGKTSKPWQNKIRRKLGWYLFFFHLFSFLFVICREMFSLIIEPTEWDLMPIRLQLLIREACTFIQMYENKLSWLRAANQEIPTAWPVGETYNSTTSDVSIAQQYVNTPLDEKLSSLSNICRVCSMESEWKVSDCTFLIILNFKA